MFSEQENNIPVGFAMSLAQNEQALDYYSTLNSSMKNDIKLFIQDASTGDDAKRRIEVAIENLSNQNTSFIRWFNLL